MAECESPATRWVDRESPVTRSTDRESPATWSRQGRHKGALAGDIEGGEEKSDYRGFRSAPDRIRTCDLRFRRPTLYPAELRARAAGRASRGSILGGAAWSRAC